jgi:hypothetical protein
MLNVNSTYIDTEYTMHQLGHLTMYLINMQTYVIPDHSHNWKAE